MCTKCSMSSSRNTGMCTWIRYPRRELPKRGRERERASVAVSWRGRGTTRRYQIYPRTACPFTSVTCVQLIWQDCVVTLFSSCGTWHLSGAEARSERTVKTRWAHIHDMLLLHRTLKWLHRKCLRITVKGNWHHIMRTCRQQHMVRQYLCIMSEQNNITIHR